MDGQFRSHLLRSTGNDSLDHFLIGLTVLAFALKRHDLGPGEHGACFGNPSSNARESGMPPFGRDLR